MLLNSNHLKVGIWDLKKMLHSSNGDFLCPSLWVSTKYLSILDCLPTFWWPKLPEVNLTLWAGAGKDLSWPQLCLIEAWGNYRLDKRYVRTQTSLDVGVIHWIYSCPLPVGKSLCFGTAISWSVQLQIRRMIQKCEHP